MNCAYCDSIIPDGIEVCPECGKPIDKTGLGGTMKFFDMKSSVRSTGILYIIFPILLMSAAAWDLRSFFNYGFDFRSVNFIDILALTVFAAGIVFIVSGIIHIKNSGKCFLSLKNHCIKATFVTAFGTEKYLECKYEDISYAYIAKTGKHSILKIGTPEGEHKISGLNNMDEQFISSQINSAISTPEEDG